MASTTTTTPTTTPLPDYEESMPAGPRRGSGSIGPFFAVIAVMVVLTALSCIFGRVCAARAAGPDAWYDCMGWWQQRWRRCVWHRGIVREAKASAAAELEPKAKEIGNQLSLPMA